MCPVTACLPEQGELDELEREEFFRLKKVQAKKKRDASLNDAAVSPASPPTCLLLHTSDPEHTPRMPGPPIWVKTNVDVSKAQASTSAGDSMASKGPWLSANPWNRNTVTLSP